MMQIRVHFYSYFKDLTGSTDVVETLQEQSSVGDLVNQLFARFPKLEQMNRSMLIAVGVNYQPRDYILKDGDEVSFFPPVQGG